jgi:hypothetical protein
MALIKVEGGQLSTEQVVAQMQRLFGGKWKWEVTEQEGSFITKFPSKMELQRAMEFGGADVKENGVSLGMRMSFDRWVEQKEGFLLPKVWVKVFGIRKELREYQVLWAVGSLIGSTQVVDMETTRKNDFGRIFVAALNPLLIPNKLDVAVADHYFELEFEVERKGFDENGEETEFNWVGKSEGGGEEDEIEYNVVEEEEDRGREIKRQKSEAAVFGEKGHMLYKDVWDIDVLREKVQRMDREEFRKFLEDKANEIVDVVVDQKLDEIAEKVAREDDGDVLMGKEESGDSERAAMEDNSSGAVKMVEVRAEAAIPEVVLTPTRCSPRMAHSADEHILAKVGRRAAERNLERAEGSLNFAHFSPLHLDVVHSIQQLGVCLGGKEGAAVDEIDGLLVDNFEILDSESSRLGGEEFSDCESEEECLEEVESLAIKSLCGELLEEVFDDDSYHLSCDNKKASKSYKVRAKSRKRKTGKVAMSKILKVVSK